MINLINNLITTVCISDKLGTIFISQCVGGSKEKQDHMVVIRQIVHSTTSCLLSTCKHAYQSFISILWLPQL